MPLLQRVPNRQNPACAFFIDESKHDGGRRVHSFTPLSKLEATRQLLKNATGIVFPRDLPHPRQALALAVRREGLLALAGIVQEDEVVVEIGQFGFGVEVAEHEIEAAFDGGVVVFVGPARVQEAYCRFLSISCPLALHDLFAVGNHGLYAPTKRPSAGSKLMASPPFSRAFWRKLGVMGSTAAPMVTLSLENLDVASLITVSLIKAMVFEVEMSAVALHSSLVHNGTQ